jgi:hypothetical protein
MCVLAGFPTAEKPSSTRRPPSAGVECFTTVRSAGFGQAPRDVSCTPGTR